MRVPSALILIASTVALAAACSKSTPAGPDPASPPASQPLVVVDVSGAVSSGYTIFVNTDQGKTNWLSTAPDGLMAAYQGNQAWGFVAAVLAGPTALGSRPSKDFSGYKTLRIQLRGASGGESIELGIKDALDNDDGSETRKLVVLTSSWQTIDVPLTDFKTADLKHVYLTFEIVFNGATLRTIYFRDVQYLP